MEDNEFNWIILECGRLCLLGQSVHPVGSYANCLRKAQSYEKNVKCIW